MIIETIVGTAAILSAVIVKKLSRKKRHVEVATSAWNETESPYFVQIEGDYMATMNERYQLYRTKEA